MVKQILAVLLIFIFFYPLLAKDSNSSRGKQIVLNLPTASDYHIRISRSSCKDGKCKLLLELLGPTEKILVTADSFPVNDLPATSKEFKDKVDLGGLKSVEWDFGSLKSDEEVMQWRRIDMTALRLDKDTTGLMLEMEGQGADYVHHSYEIWAITVNSPSIKSVFEGSDSGGPKVMDLRFFKKSPQTPNYIISFTQDFKPPNTVDGDEWSNSINYSVFTWDEKKKVLIELPQTEEMPVPLYVAILADRPTLAETGSLLQKWLNNDKNGSSTKTQCNEEDLVFSTSISPLLKSGSFFIGKFFLDRNDALKFVKKNERCHHREQAYVKRAF